jgi:hypothetical protein
MPKALKRLENQKWINKMMEEGRTIIDLGRDSKKVAMNKEIGEYYKLELDEIALRGYDKVVKIPWL